MSVDSLQADLENEKAQESVAVAVLLFEASRIARLIKDSNAEAHARMQ